MGDQNDASAKQNSSAKDLELSTKRMGNLHISNGKTTKGRNENEGASCFEPTPEQHKVEGKTKGTACNVTARRQLFTPASTETAETEDGEWLKEHPWENKYPNHSEKMSRTVSKSRNYPVSEYWCNKTEIDLDKIYTELPKFIEQMRGPSDLNCLLKAARLKYDENGKMPETVTTPCTPHIQELVQKGAKDRRSDRKQDNTYKAYSVAPEAARKSKKDYWYLDCEYMLKMSLPGDNSQWFEPFEPEKGSKRIRKIRTEKKDKRWIFIPSYRRSEIALLDWPEDDIVTQDSTIRILVVRPSQFDEYVEKYGQMFPVISVPQDEIGVGYPRFWIQKIALRLKLDFIWMIDDSVECFYEYHPTQLPPNQEYKTYRRRPFGRVFERIEKLVKDKKGGESKIAAMSPRIFRPELTVVNSLTNPFVCLPPRCAVFLNLKLLKEKDVYYRPELKHKEDMIFGYECEQNGLKVFLDNRIHLQDHQWKDTGAMSPSVQQHQTEANT